MTGRVWHLLVVHPFRNPDGSVEDNPRPACGANLRPGWENKATPALDEVTCERCRRSHHFTGAVNYRGRY